MHSHSSNLTRARLLCSYCHSIGGGWHIFSTGTTHTVCEYNTIREGFCRTGGTVGGPDMEGYLLCLDRPTANGL